MKEYKTRNDEMYLSDWYDQYLMKYLSIISKPKYSQKEMQKYNEVLLRWYDNFNGYLEEIK